MVWLEIISQWAPRVDMGALYNGVTFCVEPSKQAELISHIHPKSQRVYWVDYGLPALASYRLVCWSWYISLGSL